MALSLSRIRIHESVLYKRGKVNKNWKERWFVMNGDFKLSYYETQKKSEETFIVDNDRNILGTIDLLQIEKIELSLIQETSLRLINKYKYFKVLKDNKQNDDDRLYLIHLVTSHRIYKLSANNMITFINWIECFYSYLYNGIIFESFLDKKGEVNKAFKKRYFTLNKYKQLKYYNNNNREILHGYINLNDPLLKLNLPKQYYFNKDNFIELETTKRKWVLCVKEQDLFNEWIAFLSGLDDMEETKKPMKYIPTDATNIVNNNDDDEKEKEIYKQPGQIFRLWLKSQKDIKSGKHPQICTKLSIKLKNIGKKRRTNTTVHDIQHLLDVRTFSQRRKYGNDVADFTDNEISDDEDDYYDEFVNIEKSYD